MSTQYLSSKRYMSMLLQLAHISVRALFDHSLFKFNQEINSCCQEVISIYAHIKLNVGGDRM